MPFTEDFTVFTNENDFGTTATITIMSVPTAVKGIFDNESVPVDLGGEVPAIQKQPEFGCPLADVAGAVEGDLVVINSMNYRIKSKIEDDGTGWATLRLKKV